MMIKNYKSLATSTVRRQALQIINAGLESVKTEKAIKEQVKLKGEVLWIKNKKFDLKKHKKIVVIGFGKASSLMAKELEKILGKRIHSGIVISTVLVRLKRIWAFKGTHPSPTQKNIKATKKIIRMIKKLDQDDLVLCLISGGGSALLCYPTIPLKQYLRIVNQAFRSGIDIKKFNNIRREISYVKGGKLAKQTKAKVVSLIFSDVIGDDLSTIASGPTVGKNLKNVSNIIILNNMTALQAMKEKATKLGLKPKIVTNKLAGEAKLAGQKMIKKMPKNTALLFAGETTVKVRGKGKGGRCQEMCLVAIEKISKMEKAALLCAGTDGRDGPVNAAGALVDNQSWEQAKKKKLNYQKYLKSNDSYTFFKKTKGLIMTGLTGSNVGDIGIFLKK